MLYILSAIVVFYSFIAIVSILMEDEYMKSLPCSCVAMAWWWLWLVVKYVLTSI